MEISEENPSIVTVSDSSSSGENRPDRKGVDLLEGGLLPPLPAAFLRGEDRELLEPLQFVLSSELPEGDPPVVDRRALAEGLAVANSAYGHPRAEELARKLAAPETAVVVTGQQPGLLGGPLYTLTKAVAAVLWAERLEAAGRPALAVFWVATEDHDFREVSRVTVPTGDGVLSVGLGEDPAPLLPVGMRTLGPNLPEALSALRGAVPGERFAAWIEAVSAWYRSGARFGEAFSRLLVGLLGERCPLLLDAMLPAVKEAEKLWLEQMVAHRLDIEAAYRGREVEIETRGFSLQVPSQPGASPLFLLYRDARRRILWLEDDRFGLRGVNDFSSPVRELEKILAENPAVVSPGVLARPAVQDAILGTYVQVVGPGEVSYLPQVAPLYEELGIAAPWVAQRPQILVLPRLKQEKLAASGLSLEALVAPDVDLDELMGRDRGRDLVAPAREEIAQALSRLKTEAEALDEGLTGPWKKTHGQIERALETFAGKVTAAAARRDEVARRRAEALRNLCRPEGKLQERVLTTAYFPGKYGIEFVEKLFSQVDLDPRQLQVITP
jgi:bacillithiol biosynthesis cysteine-adding enzyme BshC